MKKSQWGTKNNTMFYRKWRYVSLCRIGGCFNLRDVTGFWSFIFQPNSRSSTHSSLSPIIKKIAIRSQWPEGKLCHESSDAAYIVDATYIFLDILMTFFPSLELVFKRGCEIVPFIQLIIALNFHSSKIT